MAGKASDQIRDFMRNFPRFECIACHITKPRSEFSPSKRKLNGLQSMCKACFLKYQSNKNKENNIEYKKNKDIIYNKRKEMHFNKRKEMYDAEKIQNIIKKLLKNRND